MAGVGLDLDLNHIFPSTPPLPHTQKMPSIPQLLAVFPRTRCHHASWSPCAKVQPGPFEHFPSCQNLQRSFFLSVAKFDAFFFHAFLLFFLDAPGWSLFYISTTSILWVKLCCNLCMVQMLEKKTIDPTKRMVRISSIPLQEGHKISSSMIIPLIKLPN